MRMNLDRIRGYLHKLTMGTAASLPEPMKDLGAYDSAIDSMGAAAEAADDTDWLQIAMDAVIADPQDRIGLFAGQVFPYREDELVRLFSYAWRRLWPDEPVRESGSVSDVSFETMSDELWEDLKEIYE